MRHADNAVPGGLSFVFATMPESLDVSVANMHAVAEHIALSNEH